MGDKCIEEEYEDLLKENNLPRTALEHIFRHQKVSAGTMAPYSAVVAIAKKALGGDG